MLGLRMRVQSMRGGTRLVRTRGMQSPRHSVFINEYHPSRGNVSVVHLRFACSTALGFDRPRSQAGNLRKWPETKGSARLIEPC